MSAPGRLKRTTIKRNAKARKLGKKSKKLRENHGTTAALPLEGPLPALRYGRAVEADSIVVPQELLR